MNEKIKELLEKIERRLRFVEEREGVPGDWRWRSDIRSLFDIQKEIILEMEKLQETVKKLNGEQFQRRYLTGKENKFSKL